jgi:hypothetical protein
VPKATDRFCSAGDFLRLHGWAVGFLGANIINKSCWDISDTRYIGTYFSHVGKIFSQLKPNDKIYAISEELIYNRAESLDSFSWLKDCFEVNAGFGEMIKILSDHLPIWSADADKSLMCFEKKMNIKNTKSLLVLRAFGVYNYEKYRQYLQGESLYFVYAFVALLPVPLVSYAYKVFRLGRKLLN